MEGAHLEDAFLTNTHLEYAFLKDTHLKGAHLKSAFLDHRGLLAIHSEVISLIGINLIEKNGDILFIDERYLQLHPELIQ